MSVLVRKEFTMQIEDVKKKVLEMGDLVEETVEATMTALKTQDLDLAREICENDIVINQLEIEIEEKCMMLLALQHPLAKDLRIIASALKIITDLERMGDNAVNIAKIILEIGKEPIIRPLLDIPMMADITQKMIKSSLKAFVNEDVDLAEKAARMDEEVDKLYEKVANDVFDIVVENKELIKQGTQLMLIARYLERIADHSTNICERTIYMISGKLEEIR